MEKFHKNKLRAFALLIIMVPLISCALRTNHWGLPQYEYAYKVPEEIDDGWKTSSLSDENVDPQKINELMQDILRRRYKNIHSVLLVKNGKLILEEYFHGYDRETMHELHSVSKSITSILVGIAVDKKMIPNVNEKVYEFFPEYKGSRWIDQKYDITLEDVLTMSAGIDWDEQSRRLTDKRNDIVAMIGYSDDWIRYVLDKKQIETPGKRFNYSGGLNVLLGGIIKNSTGLYADQFAEENLFGPLGISDYRWHRHPDGAINTQGGLSLKPRDMSKIGYLFLKGGRWNDRQLVSRNWVNESTRTHIDAYYGMGYGYQWWRAGAIINGQVIETFFAWGRGGQFIFVIPRFEVVVVFTSRPYDNGLGAILPFGLVPNYIITAMLPPIPPVKAVQLDPKMLEKYSGKYEFKKWDARLSVIKNDNTIYMTDPYGKTVELSPLSDSQFQGTLEKLGEVKIDFHRDQKQEIRYLIANFGLFRMRFDKIE